MKPHKFAHLVSALVVVARKYHAFESLRGYLTEVLRDAIPVEHGSKGAPEQELRIVSAKMLRDFVAADARLEETESVLRLLRCAAKDWDYNGKCSVDLAPVVRELDRLDARWNDSAPSGPCKIPNRNARRQINATKTTGIETPHPGFLGADDLTPFTTEYGQHDGRTL